MTSRRAIIIGAGPAGLTAAWELIDRTDVVPIIFEQTADIGGISKTVNYKGNRIDIGGHRFFSKADRVMAWWRNMLPLQGAPARDDRILERQVPLATSCVQRPIKAEKPREIEPPDPDKADEVMLYRQRISRILFGGQFFAYPISLTIDTLRKLGMLRTFKIGTSYLRARIRPIKEERSLEDFFINRFGRELYQTFFDDYTEKVWGVPCSQIKPEWGAQRIKGLSVTKAVVHALKQMLGKDRSLSQKGTETSLIEQFLYPKYGPGQMWEKTASVVTENGGELHLRHRAVGVVTDGDRVVAVKVRNEQTGEISEQAGDFFFSTMPVKDLIAGFDTCPDAVREVAAGLLYRDFITVGVLAKRLAITNETDIKTIDDIVPDNWIYVQERDVRVGRLQIFNNWSPYLVRDPNTVWMGAEYFCNVGDDLWERSDERFTELTVAELAKIGIIDGRDVLDTVVIRMPKTYPAYFGTYDRFDEVREYVSRFENLFLIGRNGMHRYNNQDHSMLTAMVAVDNIVKGIESKRNIWEVNTEKEYHEEK